ncbi:uncharacterized protein [Clytia hemisphaerica]|uniref:NACHT domain-containing protein n=1 Tax=Clytia hemisphaerica TaxID=252671 RepID=A0A7M5V8Z6_9CNID
MNRTIAKVINDIQFWLRLATFLHEPIKLFLIWILHNLGNQSYKGLPQNPQLLFQELSTPVNQRKINKLKGKVLQQDQLDLLLPPNGNATDSSTFDVTLLCVLIRHFTTIPAPLNGWNDKNPPAHDLSIAAFVIRAREWRNFVHHTDPDTITQAIFNQKWQDGEQIINNFGFTFPTAQLQTQSLDPRYDNVLKSLQQYAKDKANLQQQLTVLGNEIKKLKSQIKTIQQKPAGSTCVKEALDHISNNITENESRKLLKNLGIVDDGDPLKDRVTKLEDEKWLDIKRELEVIGRRDVVKHIKEKTLITKALRSASQKLEEHYEDELIRCLIEKPLSETDGETDYVMREDVFIDLVVLPSTVVDKDWSNSDRAALMEQENVPKTTIHKSIDQVLLSNDELVFIRGIGGIGKTSLLDMLTFKWAKGEIPDLSAIEFLFKFTCRDLNDTSRKFSNLQELFELKFPEVFESITFDDLMEISDRVLVIVDGIDELKDIYVESKPGGSSADSLAQLVFKLLDPKGDWLRNHKVLACGRPKAIEHVKTKLPTNSKRKTIEVCGFDDENIVKYIDNFFGENMEKATTVKDLIAQSYNLRLMARVPVFLFVICSVYKDNLLTNIINTQTELYFYSSLIFIRNHFKSKPNQYPNLMSIIEDRKVVEMLYSIMQLSVTTYMENKVVFSESDIRSLKCRFPIEETGFITKYRTGNKQKVTYQFRHLVLHEFFTALHLCVTKDIAPFKSNRELSSCKPTIVGVQRMLETNDNELFVTFYDKLDEICKSKLPRFTKLFHTKTKMETKMETKMSLFKEFVGAFLKLPSSMIKDGNVLHIDNSKDDHQEFLNLFKESRGGNIISPELKSADITCSYFRGDPQIVVNLIKQMNITMIKKLCCSTEPPFNEAVQYLTSLVLSCCGEYNTTLDILLNDGLYTRSIRVIQGEFILHITPYYIKNKKIPNEWLEKSNTFDITIINDSLVNKEDDEKTTMDFLRVITSYQKPITLGLRLGLSKVYHNKETVQALLEKHHIDTTNILIKTKLPITRESRLYNEFKNSQPISEC